MAQGDGISKKSERKIRTMKRILVISWYFPPINSSEGLVTSVSYTHLTLPTI